MAKDTGINMPAGFGGLMRYNEEYDSRIKFKPTHIIIFIILIIIFVITLKIFWPVATG
ncbi:preprotein translocase subunit Sec61beta [Candidatus Pacearchaeota archaeon]|nr:preprotein translocase subunit Sec61beta [Candidatus Pacearchaeota archaeon]